MSKSLFEHTRPRRPIWGAMLKMTKIELELLPSPHMFIFFVKGTKGGISYISNRYSKDSNNI